MRKKQLAIMIAVIIALLAAPLLGACGEEAEEAKPAPTMDKPAPTGDQPMEKPQEKKVMKIGAILDLSGPYASVCKPLHKGLEAYVDYVVQMVLEMSSYS